MKRHRLFALFAACLVVFPSLASTEDTLFQLGFASPPPESRIIKIIHSWPDEPAAQDATIATLSSQGFGGVVCNVSFNDYLQSNFKWKAFTRAVERAKAAGFSLWLYDEKGYPSGTAGGLVLCDHAGWEARGLLVADLQVENTPVNLDLPPGPLKMISAFPVIENKIVLGVGKDLSTHVTAGKLSWQPPPGRWHVFVIAVDRLYEGTHASQNLADHIPYPNLLDEAPTARFLELTHQAYARHLAPDLGRYFVSTFTDEPSLMSLFLRPMPYRVLPWSDELASKFKFRHGYSIEEKLPALLADVGPETARIRYHYWRSIGDRVSGNYFGQIQDWCHQHGVLSGGHLLMEENLVSQVPLYGDFFACLRRLDAPGIDCLTSIPEQVPWFIARLAGSAADLEGRTVTMCETSDHSQRYRPQGDKRPIQKVTEAEIRGTCNRLIASGIDTITSYYSFDGLDAEALNRLNNYVGRCCFALKGGCQAADIAVLYPVESVWTTFTPARLYANDSPRAGLIENIFRAVSEGLFAAGRDFTYVDGAALAEAKVERGSLVHGQLRWRVVVLPGADTLPLKAWRTLSEFVASGGVVVSVGARPLNSEQDFPSLEVQGLGGRMFHTGDDAPSINPNGEGGAGIFLPAGLASLTSDIVGGIVSRDLDFGQERSSLRYTHRHIGGHEIYFVINDSKQPWKGRLSFCAEGTAEQYDPFNGARSTLASSAGINLQLPAYGAMLFRFDKASQPQRLPLVSDGITHLTLRNLPVSQPIIAGGEFVRSQLTKREPVGLSQTNSGTLGSSRWEASAVLTKASVDTFLFLRFEYKEPLDLNGARAIVLETEIPEGQRAPAQLLVILHEKGGADYLAYSGRLLNSAGHEQSWVALDCFQLAGWAQDTNGHLDLDQISEIRVGWGGYFGEENEKVTFCSTAPAATFGSRTRISSAETLAATDLRPRFEQFGLKPRVQGSRPTCSVFTVAGALEFAMARRLGHTSRLSVDYLNWAGNSVCGANEDGGFFSDLWKGFEKFGVCPEEKMPYQAIYDPKRTPTAEALDDAKLAQNLDLRLHWIKEWDVKTGLTDSEIAGIKRALREGWPVCGGFRWPVTEKWENGVLQMCPAKAVRDGHSVLLVGYRDDDGQPGGGVFIFRNTAGKGQDGFMPYAYAANYMNDALWVDCAPLTSTPRE